MSRACAAPPREIARALTPHHGALVSDVTRDSPAAKAGIQRGDVIVSIDGTAVDDSAHLRTMIGMAGKGKRIAVQVERHGKPTTLEVALGETPTGQGAPAVVDAGVLSGLAV